MMGIALSNKPNDVARSDRGIIEHDGSRLGPRFCGQTRDIVKGSCRHLCDRRDIVEKSKESDAQRVFALSSEACARRRGCPICSPA